MLCTPLVWMRIAAVATLYNPSGYVIGMMQCSIQNLDFAATAVYKILYQAVKCRKCCVQIVHRSSSKFQILYTALQYSYEKLNFKSKLKAKEHSIFTN